MPDTEPIKITLEDLDRDDAATGGRADTPAGDEPAAEADPAPSKLHHQAEDTGRQVVGAAKDAAAKVTGKLAAGAAAATSRSAEIARDKMGEVLQEQSKAIADAVEQRVRDIDWKTEAQKGTEGGLRWLGERLNELADRMKDRPEAGATADNPDDEPTEPRA